ncbi:MAG: hypothetical protein LIQ31_16285 [Planctomycetes bacterium]|nr:hypothetical protein [Planctomycetota bacterium]
MAKDGRKLELYEILAAKRAKGKMPLGIEVKNARQANMPEPDPEITDAPGLIIDDALDGSAFTRAEEEPEAAEPPPTVNIEPSSRPAPAAEPPPLRMEQKRAEPSYGEIRRERTERRKERKTRIIEAPEPAPVAEPRARSPREVVFALDTALICFTVVLALIGCSYFLGYKRGQEERPAGMAGVADIETAEGNRLGIRSLSSPPRAAFRPPETDYTLVIRIEPATDELPERLELELAEALQRGRQEIGRDIPGFIFRTSGNDPHYILAVGLGQSVNDQELNRLLQVYNVMEGIALSRQPRPYIGCRIAPIRELGTAVY